MFGLNRAEVIGRLGADVVINHLANDGRAANMSAATYEGFLDSDTGERVEKTEWHRFVTCWDTVRESAGLVRSRKGVALTPFATGSHARRC